MATSSPHPSGSLRRTPLADWHLAHGGRPVDFAGWELPVRYAPGPVAEHLHTRAAASLFDVGHMGIVELHGPGADRALERLVPADVVGLAEGRQRYTVLTTADGGVIDDLMVARTGGHLTLVVNAARREADLAHLRSELAPDLEVVERTDVTLLALQGPAAVDVVAEHAPAVLELGFMGLGRVRLADVDVLVSRSGYTGEDGLELHVPVGAAEAVADLLAGHPTVAPAGLAARDSLRLEAGLCLWGHDLDETTSPVEAGLGWTIGRRRRAEGGFPGAAVVLAQLAGRAPRRRVGLRPAGRRPVRDGAVLSGADGTVVGVVTSGGFGPSIDAPIAMGYVAAASAAPGTELLADVRGRAEPVGVVALPFVPHRYARPAAAAVPTPAEEQR